MKKVAIIGAGIVGSTAAYYLSKNPAYQVTVFDYGQGQATKAAAGIAWRDWEQIFIWI